MQKWMKLRLRPWLLGYETTIRLDSRRIYTANFIAIWAIYRFRKFIIKARGQSTSGNWNFKKCLSLWMFKLLNYHETFYSLTTTLHKLKGASTEWQNNVLMESARLFVIKLFFVDIFSMFYQLTILNIFCW